MQLSFHSFEIFKSICIIQPVYFVAHTGLNGLKEIFNILPTFSHYSLVSISMKTDMHFFCHSDMVMKSCCRMQAGYVGEDVESILYKLLSVCIDEHTLHVHLNF